MTISEHHAATIFWVLFLLGCWTAVGLLSRALRIARLHFFKPQD